MIGTERYAKEVLSTDPKPSGSYVGQFLIESDTGLVFEWTGSGWVARLGGVEIDRFVKSVPTTDTFHHLGHEGKVFIHSDRHNNIASTTNDDILVCVPAGNAERQVHMRYSFKAVAQTGLLDVNVVLYEATTVSALDTMEPIVCTNRANPKTTEVTIYRAPTVTDVGDFMVHTSILGTNKGTDNKETNVPEWVLAPDGENLRYYLFRSTNNGAGLLDIVPALFFYDSEAV